MTEREPANSLKEYRNDRHWISNLSSTVGKYSTWELLDEMNKPYNLGKHGKFLEKEAMRHAVKRTIAFPPFHLTSISIWQLTQSSPDPSSLYPWEQNSTQNIFKDSKQLNSFSYNLLIVELSTRPFSIARIKAV